MKLWEGDAAAGERARSGDAGVAGDGEAEGPVDGVADADAGSDEGVGEAEAVVADLQGRAGTGGIEAVVGGAGEAEGLAETAWAGGDQTRGRAGLEAAVGEHLLDSGDGLKGAEEDAAGLARDFTAEVHAEVHSVDGVDVSVAGGTEEDLVARRGTAEGVGGRVRRGVVRAEIGFDFYDAAGQLAVGSAVDEELAEETWGDELGRVFEEGAGEEGHGGLVPGLTCVGLLA